jgi:branched-chain amino acid aminotransferase
MKIIFNGDLIESEQAPCTQTGWLIGAGIFETIRTVSGQPYALGLHLRRGYKSSDVLSIQTPALDVVMASIATLLSVEPHEDGLLRVSFDHSGQWAAVHVPYLPVTTSATVGIHPDATVSRGETLKRYPYEYRLAILEEARLLGFDETIVSNTQGNICEGAVSNIIMCIDGLWITPPTSDGVLPGIMRELVIAHCDVQVQSIPLSRIDAISSAILLSSLRIAQEVHAIAGRPLQPSHAFVAQIKAMVQLHSVG